MDRLTARSLRRHAGHEDGAQDAALDHVTLDYEARFLRRRALRTDGGREVMVDLPETVSLEDGELLAEVELTTNLIIAATESEERLSTEEIDQILGVLDDEDH